MQSVALIAGEGIGPEIAAATREVVDATGARIRWVDVAAGSAALKAGGGPVPRETLAAITSCGVALKGPVAASAGDATRSVNAVLRQELDLYASTRWACSLPGVPAPFEDVRVTVIRENTQGFYSGIEHSIDRNAAESIAIVTREGSERIIRYAFEYARAHRIRRLTLVHRHDVLRLTSGLFLEVGRQIARHYPRIVFEDLPLDRCCRWLVRDPRRFELLVTTSVFGDILVDLTAGLVGGLAVVPGLAVGPSAAIFEAVHGPASDIAGRGVANPSGLMLAAASMLEHLGHRTNAARLRAAVAAALRSRRNRTPDLGGDGNTRRFTDAVLRELEGA